MSFRLNPLTGFLDLVGNGSAAALKNFSYYFIDTTETITIPEGQEMIITQDLMVYGNLIVEGLLTQLAPDVGECMWSTIPSDVVVKVPTNRVLFYRSPFLMVEGDLRVQGDLIEV